MTVPCIVSDFTECFSEPELRTIKEIISYYSDLPENLEFQEHGITIDRLYQYHLKNY